MALREYAARNRLPHTGSTPTPRPTSPPSSTASASPPPTADRDHPRGLLKRATPGELAVPARNHRRRAARTLLRRRRRRRRTGRAGRVGLRRVGGPAHADASTPSPSAARPRPARGSRTTSASPPASPARTWPRGRRSRPRSSAPSSPARAPCRRSTTSPGTSSPACPTAARSPAGPSWPPPAPTTASCRVAELERYEMAGVYYAATELEARSAPARTSSWSAAGNSAGQAAMFLAEKARSVCVVVRRPLAATMSKLPRRSHRAATRGSRSTTG